MFKKKQIKKKIWYKKAFMLEKYKNSLSKIILKC